MAGEEWHMTVTAVGCKVSYHVTNRMTNSVTNRSRKGLEFAISPDGVHVYSAAGTTAGLVTFEVTVREGCGGTAASRNYTVIVVAGATTTNNPLCTGAWRHSVAITQIIIS